MPIKILYDYQIFEQDFGGISKVFTKRFEILKSYNDVKIELQTDYHNNFHLNQIGYKSSKLNSTYLKLIKKFIGKKRTKKFIRKLNLNLAKKKLAEKNFDIFHPTYYDKYFLDYIENKPFIIDIHDLIPEIFPEFININQNEFKAKKAILSKANKIIAVSNHTKKDLINIFDIAPEKIKVIYHGRSFENYNLDNIKNASFENTLPIDYILFVGNREGYKNFYFFIIAIRNILLDNKDLSLVCTGPNFSAREILFINDIGLEGKIIHYKINTDEELIFLYKKAKLFAFPSLYEGFGLPILEALECGCPIVASDNSSLPEIAGDAARYFNPKDFLSIKTTVENVLNDKQTRIDLINNAKERIKNFSWQKSVREMMELYNNEIDKES